MRAIGAMGLGLVITCCVVAAERAPAARQIPSLIEQLASGTNAEQADAARQLTRLGPAAEPAVEALQAKLASTDAVVRGTAAAALGAIGPPAAPATEALTELLDDAEPADGKPIWEHAGRALGRIGKSTLPQVLPLFDPENPSYRGAATALHELGPEAAPALPRSIEILEQRTGAIGPAVYVLQGLGPAAADAVPVLIELLDFTTDPPEAGMHIQYWACQALRDIGAAAAPATEQLIAKLKDGKGSVRRHAAQALGGIGTAAGEPAVEALIQASQDPLQPVRRDALIALGKFGPAAAAAAPQVKQLSMDASKSVRAAAAGALWRIEPAERTHALNVMLEELQSIHAPWEAADELAAIAPEAQAIDRVTALLTHEDSLTREQAAYCLGLMGPAASSAARPLEKLARAADEEPDVRAAAIEALARIAGQAQQVAEPAPADE